MSWSYWDTGDRTRMRRILGVVAGMDAMAATAFLIWGQWSPLSHPEPWLLVKPFVASPLAVLPCLVALVGYGLFFRGREVLGAAIGLLGSFVLAEAVAVQQGPGRGVFLSGACVLAWTVGSYWARRNEREQPERYGEAGIVAMMAASYIGACWSKLAVSGVGWVAPRNLQAFLLAHSAPDPNAVSYQVAQMVVERPWLSTLLALGTLALEGGAVLMLANARWRALSTLSLLAFHLVIFLGTGIMYPGATILLITVCLPGPWRGTGTPVPERGADWGALIPVFTVALALTALAVAFGWTEYNHAHFGSPWDDMYRGAPEAQP